MQANKNICELVCLHHKQHQKKPYKAAILTHFAL